MNNVNPNPTVRLSASSIKALTQCSLSYYYARILKLPEKTWPRTVVGSLVHSIFECLRHPRHRHHYDTIVGPVQRPDYTRSAAVARLVKMWQIKHGISEELISELNDMLWVGLVLIDFHWTGANIDPVTKRLLTHGPEHEFTLKLEDGTEIRGFIDDMAEVGDIMVIRDFKSAKSKPTVEETNNSIQGIIYQLYVWKQFKKLARVEFVYLRHAPTKRAPAKHLMVMEPSTPEQLAGLEHYLCGLKERLTGFGFEDAMARPCEDLGFCQRVCSHYEPHPYWVIVAADDKDALAPLSSYLDLDKARANVQDGQRLVERRHLGCAHRWREAPPS